MSKLEMKYQQGLIKRIKALMPDAMVLKTNPNYLQGIPDLVILYPNGWAALEVKRSATAPKQPNQDYYVSLMHGMSYAAFIYPENEKEVLSEIQRAYQHDRAARVPESI